MSNTKEIEVTTTDEIEAPDEWAGVDVEAFNAGRRNYRSAITSSETAAAKRVDAVADMVRSGADVDRVRSAINDAARDLTVNPSNYSKNALYGYAVLVTMAQALGTTVTAVELPKEARQVITSPRTEKVAETAAAYVASLGKDAINATPAGLREFGKPAIEAGESNAIESGDETSVETDPETANWTAADLATELSEYVGLISGMDDKRGLSAVVKQAKRLATAAEAQIAGLSR